MDRLAGPDRGQIAVALIGKHEFRRIEALGGRGDCGGPAVGRLDPVDVDIIVSQHGTSDRRNPDRIVLQPHFVDHLGDQLVNHSVTASRTIVHRIVRNQARLGVYPVFGRYVHFKFCHNLLLQ